MAEPRSIVSHHYGQYGCVKVKLAQLLENRGITRNHLRTLTDANYDMITRYYKGQVQRADLDFLAKICYALDCKVEDILEYEEPPEQGQSTEQ